MAKRIGNYFIFEQLGSGGMGEVFLGQHQHLPWKVAVKTIRKAQLDKDVLKSLEKRFDHEAKIQSQLRHPHIVEVKEYFVRKNGFYLVLEYMPGYLQTDRLSPGSRRQPPPPPRVIRTVTDELRVSGQPIQVERALHLIQQILQALDYAHNKEVEIDEERVTGIIHRDIKPANFLFADRDTVKLADFGIVKVSSYKPLTKTGFNPGTYAYMSPEAIIGQRELDQRSDIYSLGIALFEMLTGRTPFEPEDRHLDETAFIASFIDGHLNRVPRSVRSLQPDVPAWLDDLIQRALEKRPEDRFQSVAEMLRELEHLQEHMVEKGPEEYPETVAEPVDILTRQESEGPRVRVKKLPEAGSATDPKVDRIGSEIEEREIRVEPERPPETPAAPVERLRTLVAKVGTTRFLAWSALVVVGLGGLLLIISQSLSPTPGPQPIPSVAGESPRVTLLSMELDVWFEVGEERSRYSVVRKFKLGERYWLGLRANRAGSFYILSRWQDGTLQFLFPNPRMNQGSATVKINESVTIPGSKYSFRYEGPEDFFIVYAPNPDFASALESTYRAAASPENPNLKVAAERVGAVQEFLNSIATIGRTVTPADQPAMPALAKFRIDFRRDDVPAIVKVALRHE